MKDILIACVDGLTGFKEALQALFPKARLQRCIVHQIRNSLKYVSYTHQDAFIRDLKSIYQATTRHAAETALLNLADTWADKYAVAVRAWQNNWPELATFFDFPYAIRRMIYTTTRIEGYNRQLRRVTKTKTVFPTQDAIRKS